MNRFVVSVAETILSVFLFAAVSAAAPGNNAGLQQGQQGTENDKDAQKLTLKDYQNQVAEIRKSKGLMRTTTNDDRWAAAKRHADRHAAAVAKGKGGDK